jgi:AcrR family transcriptional regulator
VPKEAPLADKRGAIVDAATVLFSRYGFKRTSVDLIARHAEVAKATVYSYFPSKEDVFRAVCTDVIERILDGAMRASRADAVDARLQGMLAAKLVTLFDLVDASPHAAEIVDSQNRLGRALVEKADLDYLALLRRMLARADRSGEIDLAAVELTPSAAAELLLRSALGATEGAKSVAVLEKHIAELVRVFCRAVAPAARTRRR